MVGVPKTKTEESKKNYIQGTESQRSKHSFTFKTKWLSMRYDSRACVYLCICVCVFGRICAREL